MIQQHGGGGGGSANWSTDEWMFRISIILVLVLLAAVFSGLTLGLMSLDKTGLDIVIATGEDPKATVEERINAKHARKIRPIRQDGHLLLTTLLFGNVAVNSIMAILMADMTSGTVGFIVSTVVLVIFGELVPQALCSKHPLAIGAAALPVIRLLLASMYIVAKPIALVLDWAVGKDMGTLFSKGELEKMLDIHVAQKKLDSDELAIMKGAMYYKQTAVSSIMTPIADAFTLPGSTVLDQPTIERIYAAGFTRVPVWGRDLNDILGVVFAKDLIFVHPQDNGTLLDFMHLFGRSVHRVWPDSSLGDVLHAFKLGRTHLAIVHDVNNWSDVDPFYETQGVVTLEDIVEEILQTDILDERDVVEGEMAARNKRLHHPSFDTGVRHILDNNTTCKSMDEPEAMSLAKHLVATHPVFQVSTSAGVPLTAATVAALLMRSAIVEFDADQEYPPLYEMHTVAPPHCMVIVQGSVTVTTSEGKTSTAGLWTVLSAHSLLGAEGDVRSDMTATVARASYTRCLRISRLEFQRMLRPVQLTNNTSELTLKRHQSSHAINTVGRVRRSRKNPPTGHVADIVQYV
ncbi:hypothetical protein H310_06516 [Aphanomyces invadans]|uniref:CNNM transmembrane domain-containing protein n=1 Tax=Aphanomyces invadans TaxID=157072 RepID=A0A024U8S8_9STRA|nr:hypothetical protein H310_06516 [Aphanomyces invadans]ETW01998.1 hypothetical protein H310_06516 [Aphanomyces invadans]|eukprot:XP_008869846.1 hypothetical protein H310_06516 [Aphanomyces invadans]